MVKVVFLLTLFIVGCYQQDLSEIIIETECDIDFSILSDNFLVKVVNEFHDSLIISNPKVSRTDRGCIIVPKNIEEDFVVKTQSLAGLVDSTKLDPSIVNYLTLNPFYDYLDAEIFCGQIVDNSSFYLKLPVNHRKGEKLEYRTHDNSLYEIQMNNHGCVKLPRKPGHLIIDDLIFSTIYSPEPIIFAEKDPDNSGDFLSICRNSGIKDPIIKALSGGNVSNCDVLYNKLKGVKDFKNILENKGIISLAALKGLQPKSLNLSSNKIRSLKPLAEMGVDNLNVSRNLIMFLDDIPSKVRQLNISENPIYSYLFKNNDSLSSLDISKTSGISMDGIEVLKNLTILFANFMPNIVDAHALESSNNIVALFSEAVPKIAETVLKGDCSEKISTLELVAGGLTNADGLVNYSQIRNLDLNLNSIRSVDFLNKLENLANLRFMHNYGVIWDEFNYAPKLVNFGMRGSDAHNIRFLANGFFPKLIDVSFGHNNIRDISPLFDLPSLKGVMLNENPIVDCPVDSQNPAINEACRCFLAN